MVSKMAFGLFMCGYLETRVFTGGSRFRGFWTEYSVCLIMLIVFLTVVKSFQDILCMSFYIVMSADSR